MNWEDINNEYQTVRRAKVFGGWLVTIMDEVVESRGDNNHITGQSGYQWRSAITFVPDPDHRWNPEHDYSIEANLSINKGDKFVCLTTVYKDLSVQYRKGRCYTADENNNIPGDRYKMSYYKQIDPSIFRKL